MSWANYNINNRVGTVLLGFISLALVSFVFLFVLQNVQSATPVFGVIYPDIREPYRSVFLSFIDGMDAALRPDPERYELDSDFDVDDIERWLRNKRIDAVLALGSRSVGAVAQLTNPPTLTVGAITAPPPEHLNASGILITPDPAELFGRLKLLMPDIRKVYVVYDPTKSEWLIRRAIGVAEAYALQLEALPVLDMMEAASTYRDIFEVQNGSSQKALWLLQDAVSVDEHAMLPSILAEAWSKNLVVFSSNPGHVKKGALFSLYPDNRSIGEEMVRMAVKRLSNPVVKEVIPFRNALIAVNVRTAEHLGIKLSRSQIREFDLVFPRP